VIAPQWTDGDIEQLQQAWAKAHKKRHRNPYRLLTPLPRKVRFRLWCQHRTTSVLIWLCRTRRGTFAARWLWRL